MPGYEPFVRTVKFERDLSLDIMLEAEKAEAPAAASADTDVTKSSSAKKPVIKGVRPPVVVSGNSGKRDASNCSPPFYFDKGIKVYKPGCL